MPEVSLQEIKGLVVDIGKQYEEFKTLHAKAQKDNDVLLAESIRKITEDIAAKHEMVVKAQEALDMQFKRANMFPLANGEKPEVEVKAAYEFARTRAFMQGKSVDEVDKVQGNVEEYREYKRVYMKYIRRDEKHLSMEEFKTLNLGSDPEGGYWITPAEIRDRVTKRVFETTPMRELATVQTISTHEYKIPQDPNSGFTGGWVSEQAARPTTATNTVAMKTITAHEQYVNGPITQQYLEDAAIDPAAYLADKSGDIIARTENTAFVNGTGVGQPRGFMTYANTSVGVNNWGQLEIVGSGTSGAFSYNGLINLMVALKDGFHANASWLIKRASIASIMQLQDGGGRLIFQPIVGGNFNNTPLLGYTIRYANDMPAIAANSLSAAFGDFKQGYVIVDRVGLSTLRDPYTAKPNVLFYMRKRVGGDVDNFDAIKVQKLA